MLSLVSQSVSQDGGMTTELMEGRMTDPDFWTSTPMELIRHVELRAVVSRCPTAARCRSGLLLLMLQQLYVVIVSRLSNPLILYWSITDRWLLLFPVLS